jgi:2-C-methyl-D-erythritol 4-phosphate cytidylyltransferase/2-C-methyl-D-erythritol 2,4-cyclodiphosphate synthase
MFVTAIIAAGGHGSRFGGATPKQLIEIAGEPILARSVRAFATHPAVNEVIVALPDDIAANPPEYLRAPRVRVVVGGARRQDSVASGFAAVSSACDVVVIHDAARPFASPDLIQRAIEAAAESGAAVAAIASRDTVKLVVRQAHHEREEDPLTLRPLNKDPLGLSPLKEDPLGLSPLKGDPLTLSPSKGERMIVRETLPRETIYLAQTPQAFRRDVLRDALALTDDATDEAALAERAGHPVRIVEGDATNIKITTPDDMVIAEAILRSADRGLRNTKPARTGRAGTGYDLHRLVGGRPLILGGVRIPSDRGAHGHSDADVVCHAVTDAVLGALALGDIGRHFPDTDPQWKDANSVDLLARAVALVHEQGYEVGNVDVTVILEWPKIKDHIDVMRQTLAATLGIDPARVSIKGKTNEGVDAVGRGEAIAAHAVALLRASS